MTPTGIRDRLAGLIGKRIAFIRRLLYVFAGRVESDIGPVEITFSDGSTFLFNVGPDGESLRIEEGQWRDPFREPLSSENREFVERSGKVTAFDVSAKPPYSPLIGRTVLDVQPIVGPLNKITGTNIITDAGTIRVTIGADEVLVDLT
jgi:hypothetical protein